MTSVLVVAELQNKTVRKTTSSAITFAKNVARKLGGSFDILVMGEGVEEAASNLLAYGAHRVLKCEIEGGYVGEKYLPSLEQIIKQHQYGVICATTSSFATDLLPRAAARFNAGIAPDICAFEVRDNALVYTRPMYAGNIFGKMTIASPMQFVTLRQTEFEAAQRDASSSETLTISPIEGPLAQRVRFLDLETTESERPELSEAEVVVSGGRSLKSAENFEKVLEPLVDILGGAMGASRAACDAGYVPNDLQVGQTGKVVAPKLYIAVGISGAIQHLAGMKGSKVIVAINKDKDAPIAQVADYFLVADLFDAVPTLTEKVKTLKA